MTLLENTYHKLKQAQLTTTCEAFSRDYIGKSRTWFAWRRHAGRDFSPAAAIHCLRSIRAQRQRNRALNGLQLGALAEAERELLQHLNERHFVADVLC